MKKYLLNGKWRMFGNGYDVNGNIPGSVYSFLHVDNNILPDPYYRDNEDLYLEIAEHEYSFEKRFFFKKGEYATFLVFDGLDTLCSIYLNDVFVAKTDNMHVQYIFDVTHLLVDGDNALKVLCSPINPYIKEKDRQAELFGAYDCMKGYPYIRKAHSMMGWDWGPRLPDMGIWRDVYLLEKDSAQIKDVHVLQRHTDGSVFVAPNVEIDGNAQIRIKVVEPKGGFFEIPANQETKIENPRLWWPNGLGEQNLYTFVISLIENGIVVDEKKLTVGLRDLQLVREHDEFGESFYHKINGIDMFAMGADYIPEDNILSRINPQRTKRLLQTCKEANFNSIRVWGGGFYPDDSFFEACDELGIVVFFDLMFACSIYDPDAAAMDSILKEIRQNLTRIRHHACLGLICGNNEIEWHFDEYMQLSKRNDASYLRAKYIRMFEDLIPKTVKEVAPYLAYVSSSPTSVGGFENPNDENCGDSHYWNTEYTLCRNKFFRYISEFGFQSFPCMQTIESFTDLEDRNAFSLIMEKHQRSNGGNEIIAKYLSRNFLHPTSLKMLVYASQLLQAESVRYRVEHFRRNRGRCMGTLYWQLNDIWPGISWSSIDYYGRYKALHYFARRFYAPVLLSCEELGDVTHKPFINTEKGTYIDAKSAKFCITNDTTENVVATVKWELRDESSKLLESGRETLQVQALSLQKLQELNFGNIDSTRVHLSYSLEIGGDEVSFGTVLFTFPKYYRFSNPKLSFEIKGDEITVHSLAYAKSVFIENRDGDLVLDDNFFDMEKGKKTVRILQGRPENIRIYSIYDIQ